jgi:hypothetical protein
MNPTTLYLSMLMGPIFIILGVSMLFNMGFLKNFLKDLPKDHSFLFADGILETASGLAIVLSHNLWATPLEIIISLIGWAMVLEGTLILIVTKPYIKLALKMVGKGTKGALMLGGIICVLLGAYMSSMGYMM